MDMGSVISKCWNTCRQQLQHHTALWALVAPLSAVVLGATFSITRASTKPEVIIDRWHERPLHRMINWNNHDYKLIVRKESKALYFEDKPLTNLLDEIYAGDRYA